MEEAQGKRNSDAEQRTELLRQRMQRDLNRAEDSDRITRKHGLKQLHEHLQRESKVDLEATSRCFEVHVLPVALGAVADPMEKCREIALTILSMTNNVPLMQDLSRVADQFLQALLARLNTNPFPEPAEELRLMVLGLCCDVLKHPTLKPLLTDPQFLNPVLAALPRVLTDSFPMVKAKAAQLTGHLAAVSPYCTRLHAKALLKALTVNTLHQQSKVRQPTFKAVGTCLSCARDNFDELVRDFFLVPASKALFDRTMSVRKEVARALATALKLRASKDLFPQVFLLYDLQNSEAECVRLLLMCMADEEPQVCQYAVKQASKLGNILLQKGPYTATVVPGVDGHADCAEVILNLSQTPRSCSPASTVPMELEAVEMDVHEAQKALECFVRSTLRQVMPLIISDTRHWMLQTRVRSVQTLAVQASVASKSITAYIPELLSCLCACACDDEISVQDAAQRCSTELALQVDSNELLDLLLPRIAGTIPGQESVSFRTGALVVLASCVHSISKADSKLLERIAQALADRDLLNIKDEVVRIALLRSVQTVLQHFSQSVWLAQGARSRTVFNITSTLVQLAAPVTLEDELPAQAIATMQHWAMSSLNESGDQALVQIHYEALMESLMNCKDTTVVQWEADDSNFEAFDTIVRTYPQIVLSHLEQLNVWPILEWHSSPSRKAELRLKTMTAIETFLSKCCPELELRDLLQQHSRVVVERIILPNIVWRTGRVEAMLRKVALTGLYSILKSQALSRDTLLHVSSELLPLLKTNLDDHDASSRGLSCWCLKSLFDMFKSELSEDMARDMYPELLKRLDDGSDEIRKSVCCCIASFVKAVVPGGLSSTTKEYMLDQLFVHLDDQDTSIQDVVETVVLAIAALDRDLVMQKAANFRLSHRSPMRCDAILLNVST